MASAVGQAELERIFVAADGSVKALYTDNSLLLLSSSGASFTRVSSAGARTVQLTECCLNRWKPCVAELLAFRNQHLDVSCFPTWLQKQLQEQHNLLFSTGYPVTDTVWPATAEDAVERGLVELSAGDTIQLYSCCGSACITLQYTGLRFAVSYPLLLSCDTSSSTFTYVQHTQVFSRSQYPARWQHPLQVAVAAADLAAHSRQQQQQQHDTPPWRELVSTQQLQDPHQQLLLDITNKLSLAAAHPSSPVRHSCSTAGVCHSVAPGSTSSSPRRCGCPIQRQHKPWQQQPTMLRSQQQEQCQAGMCSPRNVLGTPLHAAVSPALHRSAQHDAAAPGALVQHTKPWCPPGSPGSPSAALYAVAEQQQQQLESCELRRPAAAGSATRGHSSLSCVVQLPVMPDVLRSLPAHHRHQQASRAGAEGSVTAQPHSINPNSCTSAGGDWNSHIATALAEALGQRQQGGSGDVGSWWLEPHLLLPHDELLHMVWSPEATCIFLEAISEVEVWLHADDTGLFSFQGGAFLTHLQPQAAPAGPIPHAAAGSAASNTPSSTALVAAAAAEPWHAAAPGPAAPRATAIAPAPAVVGSTWPMPGAIGLSGSEGLLLGCLDASEVSRVYATSTLSVELTVPALQQDGRRSGVMIPLGCIATEALRLRSVMARVKASQTTAEQVGSAPVPQPSRWLLQQQPGHLASLQHPCQELLVMPQHSVPNSTHAMQRQQQQQQLSLEVVEDQDVPDVGRFTAYADGRVRVLFADRTILTLDAGRERAQLILPDGSKREVSASKPVGVEEYVQAALEFATWSSHTPVQRAAALRMQALVAAELRSSARMAAICEWGSNSTRPPAASVDCGGTHSAAAEKPSEWCVETLLQANSALLGRL